MFNIDYLSHIINIIMINTINIIRIINTHVIGTFPSRSINKLIPLDCIANPIPRRCSDP